MFNSLQQVWEEDRTKHIAPQKELVEAYYNILHGFYEPLTKYAKENQDKYNEEKDLPIRYALKNLADKVYSEMDYKDLRQSTEKCWKYLSRLTSSTYCMMCDSLESRTRYADPKHWNTSTADLNKWALECGKYLTNSIDFMNFLENVQTTILTKDNSFEPKEKKGPKMDNVDKRLLTQTVRQCASDPVKCNSNIILQYYRIGLLTKLDVVNGAYIISISQALEKHFKDIQNLPTVNIQKETDEKDAKKSRLLNKKLLTNVSLKKRVLDVKSETGKTKPVNFATAGLSKFWTSYDEKEDIKFDLPTNSSLTKISSQVDDKLKLVDIKAYTWFQGSIRCPLAVNFGGTVRVAENLRDDPKTMERGLCNMLKASCCEERSFITYRDNWNEHSITLKVFYDAKMNARNFFINKFFPESIEERPERSKSCICANGKDDCPSLKGCKEKYDELGIKVKKAAQKGKGGFADYVINYNKCKNVINDYRLRFYCASCDSANSKFIDSKSKQVTVNTGSIENLIRSCIEKSYYEATTLSEMFKAYWEYGMKINPSMDLDPSGMFDSIKPIMEQSKSCHEYMVANENISLATNLNC